MKFFGLMLNFATLSLMGSQAACMFAVFLLLLLLLLQLEKEKGEEGTLRGLQHLRQWKSFWKVAWTSWTNWSRVVLEWNLTVTRLILQTLKACSWPLESVWAGRVREKRQTALMAMGLVEGRNCENRAASAFSRMDCFSFGHFSLYDGGCSILVASAGLEFCGRKCVAILRF